MRQELLERQTFIECLVQDLPSLPFIYACWEGGAAATGNVDTYSDVDLRLLVADGFVEEAFLEIEKVLESISPISHRRREPEPTWHGHSHCFYRLHGFPESFVLDLAILKENAPHRFTEVERHGVPLIYFDKKSTIQALSSDTEEFRLRRAKKLEDLVAFFPFLKAVTVKAIYRNKPLDAYARYQQLLQSLVEIWGIQYRPLRYDFGFRYAHVDFPKEIQAKLEKLCYHNSFATLAEKIEEIERCFTRALSELKIPTLS